MENLISPSQLETQRSPPFRQEKLESNELQSGPLGELSHAQGNKGSTPQAQRSRAVPLTGNTCLSLCIHDPAESVARSTGLELQLMFSSLCGHVIMTTCGELLIPAETYKPGHSSSIRMV